jgi:hypothetical protein
VTIRYIVDTRDVDREVDRLSKVPLAKIMELESFLVTVFQLTQQAVHVETGSLRASGMPSSDVRNEVWEGNITYGGPSLGFPNDPVMYAEYEAARGYSHDFLAPARRMDAQFRDIVIDHVEGRRV